MPAKGKIVVLCLVSMFVMNMAVSATASAAPAWEVCSEGIERLPPTKYGTNQCSGAAYYGIWQWNNPYIKEKVRIADFTLTLKDEGTLGGASTIRCPGYGVDGEGFVGPENKGEITALRVEYPGSNCLVVEGGFCRTIESVEGVNLPWQIEAYESEKTILTKLHTLPAGGEPGWKVKCSGITDECTTEGTNKQEIIKLLNVIFEGVYSLVLGELLKKHKLKCTLGGTEKGVVTGNLAISSWIGAGLRVIP